MKLKFILDCGIQNYYDASEITGYILFANCALRISMRILPEMEPSEMKGELNFVGSFS